MKRRHCYLKINKIKPSLVGFFCIFFSIWAMPDNKIDRTDSLVRLLSQDSESGKTITILNELSVLHRQKPEEVTYLHQLIEAGNRLDSASAVYGAIHNLSRYYYNACKTDSIAYWAAYVDSMAKARNENPDALFDAHSYVCQDYLWNQDYELAMNEAVQLYNLAHSTKQEYGMIRCCENLGQIYQAIRRDSDAVVIYQEALDKLEKMNGRLTFKIRLISYQIESCLRIKQYDKANDLLAEYEKRLDEQALINKSTGSVYPVDRYRWLLYSFTADLHLRQKQFTEAKLALDKASQYIGNQAVTNDYAEFVYLFVQATYHKETGDYASARKIVNLLLTKEYTPDDLTLKAEIMLGEGDLSGAISVYKEIIRLTARINNETFIRQLNQLRSLHDLNNKELQNRELQISEMRVTVKQRQLAFSILISFILLILLAVLFFYFKRTRRLKNELLKEKKSLIESEKKLIEAKNKAEEASQAKSIFIANISHEVRTPLNAIVGFAGLLADTDCLEDERKEYTSIIHTNTELLLNLVNDVLCLSEIETDVITVTIKPHDLTLCCQNAMDTIRHRVKENVELTFAPSQPGFVLNTDALQLQQILTNLLINAAKFTEKGEINLSFNIDEDKNRVRIVVTDTGCGIPLDKQSRIFERFEKLDDFKQGTGLGLSICQAIATQLGGSLSIDSAYTNGARFVFLHPINRIV